MNLEQAREKRDRILSRLNGDNQPAAPEANSDGCDTPGCGKEKGHTGRCKGSAPWNGKKASGRRNSARKPRSEKPAARTIEQTAPAAQANSKPAGLFIIEYSDESLDIRIEGTGRATFLQSLRIVQESMTEA